MRFHHFIISVRVSLCILLMLISALQVIGQSGTSVFKAKEQMDALYGLDPNLYRGTRYVPDHPEALGFPYLLQEKPFPGSIVLQGKKYLHLHLQYDINMSYNDQHNADNALIFSNLYIDTVFIDRKVFVPCDIPGIREPFMQLIASGHVSCFITWEKEYNFNSIGARSGYQYSDDIKKIYILPEGRQPKRITNRRSFLMAFNRTLRKKIRAYISKNNIKLKNASDDVLAELMTFCNSL